MFQSLSKEQGKWVLKGSWIDEMRTQKLPFSIPVLGDSRSRSSVKEKKGASVKSAERVSISYFPPKPKMKEEASHE